MWTEGQVLQSGKYQVIRRIGGGGFGLTYLAADAFFDRKVVIKTPNDTFEADQDYERYVRRFQREGQTLAKLKHSNIVSVIGFFKEAGMPCLVMAYVEGITLHERLRGGEPLAENEAVEIFRKLAAALHQVHTAGIFHCDIHPGNIMLQQNGEPVLIDFGSAKLLQPMTVTVTTTINESFSPYEQRNSENRPKATLDVYGLAATLFFAVTGIKPLPAINRKLYGDTLAFSPSFDSALSPWLCEAILKGMALEEQNRSADMQMWRRLLYPPPIQPPVQAPAQISIADEQVQQRANILERRGTTSQLVSERPSSQSSPPKSAKPEKKRYSSFPFISLGLFLLGNSPTGGCLFLLGNSHNTDPEAWTFVFYGLLSAPLAAAWVSTGVWALAEAEALVVAMALTMAWAIVGALAWAGASAVAVPGALAGVIVGALAWAVAMTGAWAAAGVWVIVAIVITIESGAVAVAVAVAWAGFLGAYLAGSDARNANAEWAGVGGSAIALAGLVAGLSTALLNSAVQNAIVVVLCLLQIVLLVRSLKPITKSLSVLYPSKNQPFIILNVACVLGMLSGAVLAWWLSSMSTAA